MTSKHDDRTRGGGLLLGAGAVLLMTICCALPVLIAGGMLTGIGGLLLGNPWVIGVGIALLAIVLLLPAGIHLPLEPFRQPHEDRGIAQLMADVQRKAGREALGLGWGGMRPGPSWQMKRDMLTPRATTHWNELVTARA
ncbi:DUF4113 domain-containing protein [Microbacterium sp. NPDC003461]